jgi:hypothetical protein
MGESSRQDFHFVLDNEYDDGQQSLTWDPDHIGGTVFFFVRGEGK